MSKMDGDNVPRGLLGIPCTLSHDIKVNVM